MGSLFLIILLSCMATIFGLCTFISSLLRRRGIDKDGAYIFTIGLAILFVCVPIFVGILKLENSETETEPYLIQVETLDTGQTRQYIINEDEDKEYLSSNNWLPDNTYCTITYKKATFFWLYEYKDRKFEFFTIPTKEIK